MLDVAEVRFEFILDIDVVDVGERLLLVVVCDWER